MLLVANKGDCTLGIIDPEVGRQVAIIPEIGVTGHEIAVARDARKAFVPIYGDAGVGRPGSDGRHMVVIDLAERKIVNNIQWDHGVRPHCAVFHPLDGLLYVTTELDRSVTIINPETLQMVGSVPTGQPESHMLAISHDGRRAYTANVGAGTVSVLDLDARKLRTIIPISGRTQRISISVDDSMVFTSDQTRPQLAVIDSANNEVKTWVELPSTGYGTAPTRDGRFLVIALRKSDQLAVLDLTSMQVVHTISVPSAPQQVVIQPDGSFAYVSCDVSQKVAMIRTSDWSVEKLINAGPAADGLAWARH